MVVLTKKEGVMCVYQALQPFKEACDNYRDDHGYCRQLTQSPGVLEVSADEILIHLFPRTQ